MPFVSHFFLPRFFGVLRSISRCRLASWHRHRQPSVSLSGGGMRASATVPQWSHIPIGVTPVYEMGCATRKASGCLLSLFSFQDFHTTGVCVYTDPLRRTPHLHLQKLAVRHGCSTLVRLQSCVVCRLVTSRQKICLSMSLLEEVVSCGYWCCGWENLADLCHDIFCLILDPCVPAERHTNFVSNDLD